MRRRRTEKLMDQMLLIMLVAFCWFFGSVSSQKQRLVVGMTLVPNAAALGAVCLDGSPPAYHLHRGSESGALNWLLQFEGGGWCNNVETCMERSKTRRGSNNYMNKLEVFSGILSNEPDMNPDFYNWNRVKIRYCDGASFTGDSIYQNGRSVLYFRGYRIWNAVVQDLLRKGLLEANKVLLSGCSAGGLATFHHCSDLRQILPRTAIVKCMSDAGFFLDMRDISGNSTMRSFFEGTVALQGVGKNLNKECTASHPAYECFFPQYALTYIKIPYFILNSAYDVFQVDHILVPPSADSNGYWSSCKLNPAACSSNQISMLQGLRSEMLTALGSFVTSKDGGMFINSCFAHCQSELQDTWHLPNSPRINSKTIAETVGDWYFERAAAKEVDCPYPCDSTCHNLVVVSTESNQVAGIRAHGY